MTAPLLSICIPTFNRARHLERLLTRLDRETAQMRAVVEILVSDNASDDDTAAVCAGATGALGETLRVFRQEANIGATANLQFTIDRARGRFCIYLADDDILFWPAVIEALGLLAEHPGAVALYAPWRLVDLETEKAHGQFYAHPGTRIFSAATRADFATFVLDHEVFSEIAIFRTDYLRQIVPVVRDIAYWGFTIPAELLAFGEVIYHPVPFYGSVTRHPGLAARTQAGNDEVQIGWDRYRGGLEHLIGLAAATLGPMALAELCRKADRMVQNRMLVGLRLRLAEGKDPVESWQLASRLRGLGRLADLPQPFELIRLRAALHFLTTQIAGMRGADALLLTGPCSVETETLIRELSALPVHCHAPGEALSGDQIVLILGQVAVEELPPDLAAAAHVISEADLLAKFP